MKPLFLAGLLIAASAYGQSDCFVGTAKSLESADVLYTETYTDRYDSKGQLMSAVVHYRTADGRPLAKKELNYRRHRYAPNLQFTHFLTGYQETITWQDDGRVTLGHSTPTGQAKQDTLTVPPPVVADAGFNTFISDHLASLAQGQTLHFNFLNPARLSWYRFTARASSGKGTTLTVTVQPERTFLRWLMDPMTFPWNSEGDSTETLMMGSRMMGLALR